MFSDFLSKGLLLLYASLVAAQSASPLYKDLNASIGDRVSDLLGRMTIEEKVAQLMQDLQAYKDEGGHVLWYILYGRPFGHGIINILLLAGYSVPWDWLATNIKRAQDYIVENTTLGIPALVQTEVQLVHKMGKLIAQEARALGVTQLFAPLADLARELRYGRVEETFSEDPYLAGEIGFQYTVGIQSLNVSATVKHFAGYSQPEQGLNTGPVQGGERYLRTTWLPSYKRAIVDAGVWSIMSAYHSYDGIPAVADYHLLTQILRKEWGYEYFVISDAGATDRLCTAFHLCRSSPIDMESVTLKALPAGNDVEMGGGSYNFQKIPDLVKSGKLDIGIVDTAVSRVLRAKFAMGLFENPYPGAPPKEWKNLIHTQEAVELARQLDKESIVLLENHDNILPLKKKGDIAVIGPMAHGFMNVLTKEQYGDYVPYRSQYHGVTPLDGVKAAVGTSARVHYAKGCERWSNDQSGFAEAIAAAQKSDVAIVVVGTWSRDGAELWQGLNATTGEHVDVNDLSLVGAQSELVRAIITTGVPTIVVLSSGKPVSEPWLSNSTSALVQQFYPSEQGGNALADVLFGDYNPSGRLSVSFPHYVGDLPIYYDYLNSGRAITDSGFVADNGTLVFGHQYVLGTPLPWYPFGYGLSYSDFEYGKVTLDKTTVSATDTVTVSVDVTNTHGGLDGTEVVQVYVVDDISSVAVPNRLLKGFEKAVIRAGETEIVKIHLKVEDLGLWDSRMQYVVEPGSFQVLVGRSSADIRGNATFQVQ
ncbi:hypothetical protein N7474_008548 [Penicillium riverlandense]|uniref:uncharacterized protein n=1 Tax=Penicillium riverlandense TaxID=1903569 RepID=UPI0025484E58|nr:uncharacterized protein N7474_008548 [Penicillium riverlandense]KAJ5812247.1 hypothetical protein N7474_008548 [Penicillium riverlandense]